MRSTIPNTERDVFIPESNRTNDLVRELINQNDTTRNNLDLAGNKISRIRNYKSIAIDGCLVALGTLGVCAGVFSTLESMKFCNATSDDGEKTYYQYLGIGSTLYSLGGMLAGSGLTNMWRHFTKHLQLEKEKNQLLRVQQEIVNRETESTEEHRAHNSNVEAIIDMNLDEVVRGRFGMCIEEINRLRSIRNHIIINNSHPIPEPMPPRYSQIMSDDSRVRRQLFSNMPPPYEENVTETR